jgi:putative aldouronate transport system substrate-binding protein
MDVRHPGAEQHDDSQRVSRRRFISVAAAGTLVGTAGASLLLSACQPQAAPPAGQSSASSGSSAPASSGTSSGSNAPAKTAGADPFPKYAPVANAPKPDYQFDDPRFDVGFDNYPQNPFKSVTEAPGRGGDVNVLVANYFPPPTPFEQNPTWQAVNKALNANVQMSMVAAADYRAKFATVMAGDDLPDIMHIFYGYTLAPNLPAFFKAKCADLTPYLAGDAAKEYPNLAAIPTYAWKNSVSAVDGALYLIPIQRHLPTFPGVGGYFFKNADMWDKEIGPDATPKNADEFKKMLQQLNRPQENRWAVGNHGRESWLFGVWQYAAMFGAPNGWKQNADGTLVKDFETEEFKAAVGFLRDLMAGGMFPPDAPTVTTSRNDFVAKKFATSVEGYGNAWVDFWRRGLQQNPQTKFALMKPFPASDGGPANVFLSPGFLSMNVLKKAEPERIKELLRILNYLAAPFGSEEDLLLSAGIKGQDYTVDDKGNPQPNQQGIANARYVPWQYVTQRPYVNYQADIPGFAKGSHEAQQIIIPAGLEDPTLGFLSPTAVGRGAAAMTVWSDGMRDVILGRKPISDYDTIVKEWKSNVGDTIRKEYADAMAAAKK